MSRVPRQRPNRARVAVVVLLSLAIVGYAVSPYLTFDPTAAESRIGLRTDVALHFPILLVHIFAGALALTLGPLQFVRRIRRVPRVHRYIGRAYLFAGVLPGSLAGMAVAWLSTAGPLASAGFALLDVAWFTTAAIGYHAIRGQRYRDHERWMIRSFAVTFAAVTFRLWLATLIVVQLPWLGSQYRDDFDALFHNAYVAAVWLAFIPNLLAVQFCFWHRRRSAGRRPLTHSA